MNRSGPISSRSATPVKFPAWEMLTVMINQLPQEALVLDAQRNRALLANQLFLDLSGVKNSDLTGKALVDILPGLEWTVTASAGQVIELLQGQKKILRKVRSVAVDDEKNFLLILLEPVPEKGALDCLEEQLGYFAEITHLSDASSIDECYHRSLHALKGLTGASMLAIYRAEGDFPRFTRVAEMEGGSEFPQNISAVQSLLVEQTSLWKAGHRTTNELQRFGLRNTLKYIAIKLIGQPGAGMGLLAIGDTELDPPASLVDLMDLGASALGQALQHFILISRLRQQAEENAHILLFHQSVYENSPEGVFLLDPDLNILECNPASEWMLGYSSQEVAGKPVESVLIGSDLLLAALDEARKGTPTHNTGVLHLNRRDGETLIAKLELLPVQHEDNLEGILVFIQDVSENEQTRARTQQLENRALMGEFTAIFTHEVGNPLNNIFAALQNMAELMPEDDINAQRVQTCLGECNRLKALMSSVLDFSRPLEPNFETVDVRILVRRMVERWRPKLANANIEPVLKMAEDVPLIKADPRLLDQVLTNLISNAVSIMAENGQGVLALRVRLDDEVPNLSQVEITITDNGPGIPEELLAHIFEPFVSKRKGGTGLGLAIVKRIITSHHGSITAQSFTPGTIFTIKIPISANGA